MWCQLTHIVKEYVLTYRQKVAPQRWGDTLYVIANDPVGRLQCTKGNSMKSGDHSLRYWSADFSEFNSLVVAQHLRASMASKASLA